MKSNKTAKTATAFLFLFFALFATAQDGIKVRGTVRNTEGIPISGVAVINTKTGITNGVSDDFGSYSVVVPADGSLKFTCVGYKEVLVAVKGRLKIDITMTQEVIELDEVVVKVEVKNKVIPEPTDIEIKGNYFHLRTRFTVPKQLFKSSTRLVMQPSIVNVTTGQRMYMRPVVFDGQEYRTAQTRMYDYDFSKDPLHEASTVKATRNNKSDIIPYHDSLYVERQNDDYRADVNLAMENYNRIIYVDSFAIAKGTIKPMRFLEYKFDGDNELDSTYIPKAEMQLRDSHGEVNLTFVINKDELDNNDPNNAVELSRLRNELSEIENDEDASLQTMFVTGLSSPDGRYAPNLALAKRRTSTALETILGMLKPSTRNVIKSGSDSKVQEWSIVADMLKADSLLNEAEQVRNIIEKFSDRDAQSQRIARLSFYKSLLAKNYLPKLRKVEYNYEYSIFRYLTDAEIRELYSSNYKKLTANEFWRLIESAKTDEEREKYCRQALEVYPKFILAANTLACQLIRTDRPDEQILDKFVTPDAPEAVKCNQAIMLLMAGKYKDAKNIVDGMEENKANAKLCAVIRALNGDYEQAFGTVAAMSNLNEVVMLLAMKRNDEAWEKASSLGLTGDAKELYVKAVAANRTEHVGEALIYLEQAFAIDPKLEEIAKIDGDVLDLLPEGQVRE